MRITLGLVLALSFGCAGTAKQSTACPPYICGQNGTQTTGVADQTAPQIEAVTLPSGETAK